MRSTGAIERRSERRSAAERASDAGSADRANECVVMVRANSSVLYASISQISHPMCERLSVIDPLCPSEMPSSILTGAFPRCTDMVNIGLGFSLVQVTLTPPCHGLHNSTSLILPVGHPSVHHAQIRCVEKGRLRIICLYSRLKRMYFFTAVVCVIGRLEISQIRYLSHLSNLCLVSNLRYCRRGK